MKCNYCGTINNENNIRCTGCNAILHEEDIEKGEKIVEKKYDIEKKNYIMHVTERGYSKTTIYEAKNFKGQLRFMLIGLCIFLIIDLFFFLLYLESKYTTSSNELLILLIILLVATFAYVIFEYIQARKKFPKNKNIK